MPVSRINGVNINWRTVGDHGPWVVMTTGGRRGYDEFMRRSRTMASGSCCMTAAIPARPTF
jgi:hypothetical protein